MPIKQKSYTCSKKIVCIISCAPFKAHTEPLMFAMRLLSVNDINQYMTAIFMYQCLNCNTAQVFNDFFQKNNILHDHDTRQANDLHVPNARLNVRKFFLRYMVLIYGTISPYSLNSRSPLMFSKTTAASSYWVKVNWTPCYELNCTDDWNVNFISTWHHLIVLRRHTATFYFYFYFFSCLILFVFLHVLINMCLQRSRVISLVVFHCP